MAFSPQLPQNYTSNLLLAVPRLARRAGALAVHYLPDNFDHFLNKLLASGSIIPNPTVTSSNLSTQAALDSVTSNFSSSSSGSSGIISAAAAAAQGTLAATSTTAGAAAAAAAAIGNADAPLSASSSLSHLILHPPLIHLRRLTTFTAYLISKWSLATAIIAFTLNRTHVYASVRTPLRLSWITRLILHALPLFLTAAQTIVVLRAIRCQTSPDYAMLRYGNASAVYELDHAGDGGALHSMAQTVLMRLGEATDADSCRAVNMAALPKGQGLKHYGSLSLLWPLYLSFCGSTFVETLSSALQGRQPTVENSLFEQSFAFAEAEALIVRPFEIAAAAAAHGGDADAAEALLTPAQARRLMNVTPEVLLIGLIATVSTLASNLLAVLGKRKKWRLVNTGIWGTAYMAAFAWGLYRFYTVENPDAWSFRFPTVFVIGFVPHLMVAAGIFCCATIYVFALLSMMVLTPPGQAPLSLRDRFYQACDNLQANVYLRTGESLRFSWSDDFYSTLLKFGFTILTCASEVVYLNEGTRVQVPNMTWLERQRMAEITNGYSFLHKQTRDSVPNELKRRAVAGNGTIDRVDRRLQSQSGYAVERKPKNRDRNAEPVSLDGHGTGVTHHQSRWHLAIRFLRGFMWLWLAFALQTVFMTLRMVGISWRPRWVNRLIGPAIANKPTQSATSDSRLHKFYLVGDDGSKRVARDLDVDVELELRKQHNLGVLQPPLSSTELEQEIDSRLYDWWKGNGWWGETDSSGDYVPRAIEVSQGYDDDDLTSVISESQASTSAWLTDNEEEDDDSPLASGQRTPTQNDHFNLLMRPAAMTRASKATPEPVLDPNLLANLLDPQTPDQLSEARMLARRLRTPHTLTRSAYAQANLRSQAALLSSSRVFRHQLELHQRGQRQRHVVKQTMSDAEEQRALEAFILSQRRQKRGNQTDAGLQGQTHDEYENHHHNHHHQANNDEDDDDDWATGAPGLGSSGPVCVVCQDAPRTILLWPCGCLALCDECRVTMATRNFTSCVCCRTGTEAFSRLFVP